VGDDDERERRDRKRAHRVGGEHESAAVPAVGGDAGEQAEQRDRQQPRERHEARLGR